MKIRSSAKLIETAVAPALSELGLYSFGWFVMADDPFEGRKAMLVGNRANESNHRMWQVFCQSPEYGDGLANPMNRWTERVIGEVAKQYDAVGLYPFGEKLWPFQQYAKQATGMQSSPIGILIHPVYGLWHAFRAVLVFDRDIALAPVEKLIHPCDECLEKPCLSACPVDAFSDNGFAADDCRRHLGSGREPLCMETGCRARAACPVGLPYKNEQIRFHMKAFA
jgi:hypothetical protein